MATTTTHSNWDYYAEEYYDGEISWNERDDPCKPAYYRYGSNIRDARNLLASNIGLIAKRAQRGKLLAVATALDTAKPLAGVKIDAMSYQNQVLASGRTDANGMVELDPRGTPFALIADDGGRKGYLRVANGVALPVSHFDVGGETVVAGLKGYLYGDRGVWRPGDTIYLTFALQDRTQTLPPDHPVTVELRNPRGQLVQTLTNSKPVGQFYAFELKTAADAPTGDWNALALVGGATFRQDAEGRDRDAQPAQDRAGSRARSRSSKVLRSRARSMRNGCRAPRRRACARRSKCGSRVRPRASRAMRTTCSTIRRARSAGRRSPCSTVSSMPKARRRSTRTSICRATRRAC